MSTERSPSRDRTALARQTNSSVDHGRAAVPMWDSSDPERAPPPLPLNPTTGSQSPITKPNTSSAIAAAAQQIIERARESTPISSYTSNATPLGSPERSLVKGAQHKRMQSLQTGSVKDLRSYIDNRSPERSPERPASVNSYTKDYVSSMMDHSSSPTPVGKDLLKDTPSLRPTTRVPPRPILGENTPPSSTMLALQTMKVPDDIADVIRPSTPTTPRPNTTYDFSSQLLNLTNIATNLQKEMAAISRRSKDNATDLLSLKEATLQRDEDIRKSLKDLATNVTAHNVLGPSPAPGNISRSASSYGGLFLDDKAFNSPPPKHYSIPRVSSVPNFADDARVGSPSPYSVEGAASVAMLEKIIREMVTKEGQERLLSTLSELFDKSSKTNIQAAKKVEELAGFIKEKSANNALVPISQSASGAPRLDLSFDSPKSSPRGSGDSKALPNDEVFRLLQKIRDSIALSGGTTAEVKGLVRDMRGEVLGMGRELGRKLDQVSAAQLNNTLDRSIETGTDDQNSRELHATVEEALEEIKGRLADLAYDRTASTQVTVAQPALDSDHIYSVVKHALVDHGETSKSVVEHSGVDREGVLDAVKEGLKDFEPNIELQQFGLERDEILTVLKEGLEDYQQNKAEPSPSGIDKGELYEMMQEALKDFQPGAQIRHEILADVQAALAEFNPRAAFDGEAIQHAVLEAVKLGMVEHGPAAPRELEISRDDLFDAVKSSLDGTTIPFNSFGEQVLRQLHELIDGMRIEFKQYSAANGRDTEQVLDAVKDGLEALRTEIESYVDRAQDVTGKDEIIDTVRNGLEQLRHDVQQQPRDSGNELLDYLKAEFEQLHEVDRTREVPSEHVDRSLGMLEALQVGMSELQSRHRSRSMSSQDETKDEMYEAMKEEFEQLRSAILHGHASDKGELIETIQDNLGALHSRLNGSELSSQSTEDILSNIREEFSQLKASLALTMDEGDRDAIVTGVKRSIDDLRIQLAADHSDASAESMGVLKEELERFREMMGGSVVVGNDSQHESLVAIRESLEELRGNVSKPVPDDLLEALRNEFETLRGTGSNEEVVDTIRVGLDDLRSSLEKKLDSPERRDAQQSELLDVIGEGLDTLRADVLKTLDKPLDMTVNYEILDTLKEGLTALRAEMDNLKPSSSKSGQIVLAEGIVTESARESGEPQPSAAEQLGIDKIELLITQLQIKIEALAASVHDGVGHNNAATRSDLEGIEVHLKDLQETVLTFAEKDTSAPEGAATRADTDAIETLLRNTKSHLEDVIPSGTGLATKDHVESIEGIVSLTSEMVDNLKERFDDLVGKSDIDVLAQDIRKLVNDTTTEHMTKADLDVLGVLCTDIKMKLESMEIPEAASKADMEQLQGLLADFRESHDKLRDSYEGDIAITAKAFDDRKEEFESTIKQIDEVKLAVLDAKDDLLHRLTHEDVGLEIIVDKLKNLEEKSFGGMSLEVSEILELVKAEFEKSHTSVEALKVDNEHNAVTALEKQGEHKEALVTELGERLDTLFDGLMSKYDDAQLAAAEHAKAVEEKSNSHEALFMSTKDMADDLKLSIDTLGTSLTSFTASYPDTMDKMAQDSKLTFNRVDDTYNKLDETASGLQHEHTVTREELQKVMSTLQTMHNDVSEYNPRLMMSLREVQALITQHFDHSQKAAEAAEQNATAVRELQDALRNGFEEAKGHNSSQTEALRGAFLLPAPEAAKEVRDDGMHEKLDSLLSTVKGSSSDAQLERLDQIHEKVMATAAEVSAFISQSRQIEPVDDARAAQRDQLEADIAVLDEEKEEMQSEINALKQERDALVAQKLKAATELSSVETALSIRREELHNMEAKAETIERRMLEGIMNQSRMLLLNKVKPTRKPQGRDLRVASNNSTISTLTTSTMPLQATHALAMKTRQPAPSAERRIMSLNQINHNVPTGGAALVNTGMKRSHSVKTGFNRKTSWASVGRRLSEFNKENELSEEEEEEDDDFHSVTHRDDESERRTSYDQSEVDSEAEREFGDAGMLRLEGMQHKSVYAPASDSGIGSEVPTAALSGSEHGGYFK